VNRRVLGQKFSRLATNAVVRSPRLWRVFRPFMARLFDGIAGTWDAGRAPDHLASFERALAAVDPAPASALDLGTGTGQGAFAIARHFPEAKVTGADVADEMLAQATRKTPAELRDRVRFEHADAAALPYADGSFELVAHANMIPFFDEVARVTAPHGYVAVAYGLGARTPIFVPLERVRAELEQRGFVHVANFEVGGGLSLLARKRELA
jgi:SAM-dependent methyltransferase